MADRPDSIPALDIVSHDVYAAGVPHEAFARFRREAPVSWVNEPDGPGFWSVTRWRELTAVHRDPATFSSEIGGTEMEDLAPDARAARRTMLETDPPRHGELRRIVNPTFSRRAIEQHRDHAERLVRQVLGEAIGSGEVEFVHSVARELPIRMLCEVMGLPPQDAPVLFEWADAIVYNADPDFSELISDQVDTDPYRLLPFRSPVSLEVFGYAQRLVAARRAAPAGDLVSVMAQALVGGAPLTETEFNTFFLLLVIAGNETTRQSLAHGLVAFAEHPDQLERVRADRALLPTAVDEVLRWSCPQIHFRRTATRPTELGGVGIEAGDKVVTWYVSANYDEAEFADPYRFDIGRTPNRHVTFGGGGPHLCLGQWLARLEVQVFVEALCDMVGTIELTGPPERVRSNFINGLKRLPVRLTPRSIRPSRCAGDHRGRTERGLRAWWYRPRMGLEGTGQRWPCRRSVSRSVGVGVPALLFASLCAALPDAAAQDARCATEIRVRGDERVLPGACSDLTGHTVTDGVWRIVIPQRGTSVRGAAIGVGGESSMGVSHEPDGSIVVVTDEWDRSTGAAEVTDTGCSNPNAFSLWSGSWRTNWRYLVNMTAIPAASRSAFTSAVRRGIGRIAQRTTNCGASLALPASIKPVEVGATSLQPNVTISSVLTCGTRDGKSVVGARRTTAVTGTLAAACVWWVNWAMVEGDQVYRPDGDPATFGPIRWWTNAATSGCSGRRFDLESVATHETGHTYGLGHVAQTTWQTMTPLTYSCESVPVSAAFVGRTLGSGDLAGLRVKYG